MQLKPTKSSPPDGIETLRLADRPIPEAGSRQVQVQINAFSINYHDPGTASDPGTSGIPYSTIPNSDVASEVTALSERVTRFEVGDGIMGTFIQNWVDADDAGRRRQCAWRVNRRAVDGIRGSGLRRIGLNAIPPQRYQSRNPPLRRCHRVA